jgi:hypothetical protein
MTAYHFDGDPAIDRRHLERVLHRPTPRRWPWLVAMLAGGAALTFWRLRPRAQKPPSTRIPKRPSSPRPR